MMKVSTALIFCLLVIFGFFSFKQKKDDVGILSYTVDLSTQDLRFFWKDKKGNVLKDYENLSKEIAQENKKLVFAMNGGMFQKDLSPLGLYIEKGSELSTLNKRENAYGNFYLQPNGVFYITDNNKGAVCKTTDFVNKDVKYATQSGPMLLIDGRVHSAFRKGSSNLNIRNGVGVLPDGQLLFAMSKGKINFYDFASYFKSKGCKNALYLDGFVSRTYLPEKGYTSKIGKFGVMIGVVE